MNMVRALVRPVLTVAGLAVLSAAVMLGKDVPESYTGMVAGMLAWWFYDRSKGRLKP